MKVLNKTLGCGRDRLISCVYMTLVVMNVSAVHYDLSLVGTKMGIKRRTGERGGDRPIQNTHNFTSVSTDQRDDIQ